MILTDTQGDKMLGLESLDEQINTYFDDEIADNELVGLEARMAKSDYVKNYVDEKCFAYFKITNSIKIVKIRSNEVAGRIADDFIENKLNRLFFKFNPVSFKGFNKILSRFLLNVHRNDS